MICEEMDSMCPVKVVFSDEEENNVKGGGVPGSNDDDPTDNHIPYGGDDDDDDDNSFNTVSVNDIDNLMDDISDEEDGESLSTMSARESPRSPFGKVLGIGLQNLSTQETDHGNSYFENEGDDSRQAVHLTDNNMNSATINANDKLLERIKRFQNKKVRSNANEEINTANKWTARIEKDPPPAEIPKEQWLEILKSQRKRSLRDLSWTNVMASVLRQRNPYCCFRFRRHSVITKGSTRSNILFNAEGTCVFKGCPVAFQVNVKRDKPFDAIINFSTDTCVHAEGEVKRRPIRGKLRKIYAKKLRHMSATSLAALKLSEVPQDVKESGNRDGIPSTKVLNQISSEYKRNHEVQQDQMPDTVKQFEDKRVMENKSTIPREPKQRRRIKRAGIVEKHLPKDIQEGGKELENKYNITATIIPKKSRSGCKKRQTSQHGKSNYVLAEIPESGNRYETPASKVASQNSSECTKHQGFQQDNMFYLADTPELGNKCGAQTTTISSGFTKHQDEIYYVLAEIPESGDKSGIQTSSIVDQISSGYTQYLGSQQNNAYYVMDDTPKTGNINSVPTTKELKQTFPGFTSHHGVRQGDILGEHVYAHTSKRVTKPGNTCDIPMTNLPNQISSVSTKYSRAQQDKIYYVLAEIPPAGSESEGLTSAEAAKLLDQIGCQPVDVQEAQQSEIIEERVLSFAESFMFDYQINNV